VTFSEVSETDLFLFLTRQFTVAKSVCRTFPNEYGFMIGVNAVIGR
jgi:hypothetical protein